MRICLAPERESARQKEKASWAALPGQEFGNLRAEMTALFALAPATGVARQDNQDAAYAEAAGCSPSPTA